MKRAGKSSRLSKTGFRKSLTVQQHHCGFGQKLTGCGIRLDSDFPIQKSSFRPSSFPTVRAVISNRFPPLYPPCTNEVRPVCRIVAINTLRHLVTLPSVPAAARQFEPQVFESSESSTPYFVSFAAPCDISRIQQVSKLVKGFAGSIFENLFSYLS